MTKSTRIISLILSFMIVFNFMFSSLTISFASEEDEEYTSTGNSMDESGQKVDYVQKVITWLFVFGIADQLKALISVMFGNVSIDALLFNKYDDTRLAFYADTQVNGHNKFLETPSADSGILAMVRGYYSIFREIAIAFYLIMLLYIGLRIIMKSTGRERDKFKTMLLDWAIGVFILFMFPYAIKYLIMFNEGLVETLDRRIVQNSGNDISSMLPQTNIDVDQELLLAMGQVEADEDSNLMAQFRKKAVDTGNLAYGFVYIYLLFKLLSFIIIYFKRLITVIFLIVLFPFVAISYAVDKIKDGQAQIFMAWLRELLLNIFLQFFQAAVYVAVMFVVNAFISSGDANIVLVCIGIGFISKSESLLKSLFPSLMRGGGANTVSPVSQTLQTAVALKLVKDVASRGQQVGQRFVSAKNAYNEKTEAFRNVSAAKVEKNLLKIDEKLLAKQSGAAARSTNAGARSTIEQATMDTARGIDETAPSDVREAQEAQNLNEKFEAQQQMITQVAIAGDGSQAQSFIDKNMQALSPAAQEQLGAEMLVMSAIQEMITGEGADGAVLTQQQVNLSSNIIIEAIQSGDPKYDDVKEWMKNNSITITRREAVNPSIRTDRDAAAWEKKHPGQKAFRTVKEKVSLDVYFGDPAAASKAGDNQYFGQGLKGRVLSTSDSDKMAAADKLLGGRSGLYTGKQIDGKYDIRTDKKEIASTSRAKEVPQFSPAVYKLTSLEKDEVHNKVDSTDGQKVVDKMVDYYSGINATKADKEDLKSAAELIMELGEYNERLHSNDEAQKINGVGADDMFRITSGLSNLSTKNAKVARLVSQSLGTSNTSDDTKPVEKTKTGIKVNLGTTLEGIRAMSAQTIITDKNMDSADRIKVQEDAKEYLQSISKQLEESNSELDSIAAAVYARSELDVYLGEDPELDRIYEDVGLIRSQKTNEEIMREKQNKKIEEKVKKANEAKIQALKDANARATIKLFDTTFDATAGNVVRVANVLTAEALNLGTDSKITGKGAMLSASVADDISGVVLHPAESLGNLFDEHPIEGNRPSPKAEPVGGIADELSHKAKTKAEKKDIVNDKDIDFAKQRVAVSRSKLFRDKLN